MQLYQLVPLPCGIFSGLSLVERAVFGLLYDRMKVSVKNHLSSTDNSWFDDTLEDVYCLYRQDSIAETLGVSLRTVRRALDALRDAGLIDWRKANYQDANRYTIPYRIRQELKNQ